MDHFWIFQLTANYKFCSFCSRRTTVTSSRPTIFTATVSQKRTSGRTLQLCPWNMWSQDGPNSHLITRTLPYWHKRNIQMYLNCTVAVKLYMYTNLMWIVLTIMTSFPFRVHNADYYMQEAKKLKHKADALVRLKIQYFFQNIFFVFQESFM